MQRFETAFVFAIIVGFAGLMATGIATAAHGRITCVTHAIARSYPTCHVPETTPNADRPVSVVFSVGPVQAPPQR